MNRVVFVLVAGIAVAAASNSSIPVVQDCEVQSSDGGNGQLTMETPPSSSSSSSGSDFACGAANNSQEDADVEDTNVELRFPKMPEGVRAVLHQDWAAIGGERMLEALKSQGSMEFAHARDTFYSHLQGTFGILSIWNQPPEVCRTGMVHTAYSGDLYQFFLWDAVQDRSSLQSIIGEEAEALTYLFGTINRGMLGGFGDNIANATVMKPLSEPFYNVSHRVEGTTLVSIKDAAKIIMVTIADYLEQMVDTNGWRDHHQVEFAERLYPGDGRPALGFFWFSAACHAIKDHLDVVPPIFDHCTTIVDRDDEIRARDAYWHVTLKEFELSEEEQIAGLQETIEYNPFVGEPHMLLSQLHFRNQRYYEAAREARKAIQKFYTLGSAWDKRRSYPHWVGFSRMTLLRARRMIDGKPHLPFHDESDPTYTTAHGLNLASLHEVVVQMTTYEDA